MGWIFLIWLIVAVVALMVFSWVCALYWKFARMLSNFSLEGLLFGRTFEPECSASANDPPVSNVKNLRIICRELECAPLSLHSILQHLCSCYDFVPSFVHNAPDYTVEVKLRPFDYSAAYYTAFVTLSERKGGRVLLATELPEVYPADFEALVRELVTLVALQVYLKSIPQGVAVAK